VVNARHAKKVPDRKPGVADSESLDRCGLLHPGFFPPSGLREWRRASCYRHKIDQQPPLRLEFA